MRLISNLTSTISDIEISGERAESVALINNLDPYLVLDRTARRTLESKSPPEAARRCARSGTGRGKPDSEVREGHSTGNAMII